MLPTAKSGSKQSRPRFTQNEAVAGDHRLDGLDSIQGVGDWSVLVDAPPVEAFARWALEQSTGLADSGPVGKSSAEA